MPLIAALALAAATQTVPEGTKLRPVTQCFALLRNDNVVGATFQKISATTVAGRPAWDIVVHQRVAAIKFDMRDHFVLARADLQPIAFDNRVGGQEHVRLRYAKGRVTGTKIKNDKSEAIDLATPAPVWEGNLWGLTFGALPLKDGAEFTLPFYQYDQGLGNFTLKVTGSETVQTPAGPVEAWLLDSGTGPQRRVTYLIGKADGAELGTRAPGFGSRPGGDCAGLD